MSQDEIMEIVNAQVDAAVEKSGVLRLGAIEEFLSSVQPELTVQFYGGGFPRGFHSYRGFYRFLAVGRSVNPITVAEFLCDIRAAIGKTFTGYKGGDFVMSRMTPLWVSSYGMTSGVGITGISEKDGRIILETAKVDV